MGKFLIGYEYEEEVVSYEWNEDEIEVEAENAEEAEGIALTQLRYLDSVSVVSVDEVD